MKKGTHNPNLESLVGRVFGKLRVLRFFYTSRGKRFWECQCECGNKTSGSTEKLKSSRKISCGCAYQDSVIRRYPKIELQCPGCGLFFLELLGMYNFKIKKNPNSRFFCSKECYNNHKKNDPMMPFRQILRNARGTAKMRSHRIDFDLSIDDLTSQWNKQKGICDYSGIPLELPEDDNLKIKNKLHSASLDRIDSSKGYTKNNIHFICLGMNWAKMAFSDDEFKNFIQKIDPSYSKPKVILSKGILK